MRDKAILLLARELHPKLDPTVAAARVERVLHAVFQMRGAGAAEVARSGDPDARSSMYLGHLQDRFKRLQGAVGSLIRSQLLSGAWLCSLAHVGWHSYSCLGAQNKSFYACCEPLQAAIFFWLLGASCGMRDNARMHMHTTGFHCSKWFIHGALQ